MFNIRFIVAILVVFIFVINVNGQVNDLKLTRLFLKVHKERLAEEALEEASLKERYDTQVQSCSLVHPLIPRTLTINF